MPFWEDYVAVSLAEEDALLSELGRQLAGASPRARDMLRQLGSRLAESQRQISRQRSELERYRTIYERSSSLAKLGIWECDLATDALIWTDGVYDLFGLPRGTPVTRNLCLTLYGEESRREMEALRRRAETDGIGFTLDILIHPPQGGERWVRLTADVEMQEGRPVRLFGTKQDITLEKQMVERLRVLAECDALTGIANRSVFEMRLAQALEGDVGPVALLLVDVDSFKAVNDTHGHAVGDACLREVAMRLKTGFTPGDVVARLGGDEFTVLIVGEGASDDIEGRAMTMLHRLQRPLSLEGCSVALGASIGIATSPPLAAAPDELFRAADHALYAAKAAGRNALCLAGSAPRLLRHCG